MTSEILNAQPPNIKMQKTGAKAFPIAKLHARF
jgi:hypothetical protein